MQEFRSLTKVSTNCKAKTSPANNSKTTAWDGSPKPSSESFSLNCNSPLSKILTPTKTTKIGLCASRTTCSPISQWGTSANSKHSRTSIKLSLFVSWYRCRTSVKDSCLNLRKLTKAMLTWQGSQWLKGLLINWYPRGTWKLSKLFSCSRITSSFLQLKLGANFQITRTPTLWCTPTYYLFTSTKKWVCPLCLTKSKPSFKCSKTVCSKIATWYPNGIIQVD